MYMPTPAVRSTRYTVGMPATKRVYKARAGRVAFQPSQHNVAFQLSPLVGPLPKPCAWVLQCRFSELATLSKGSLWTSHCKHSFSHGYYPPELYARPQKLRATDRSLSSKSGARIGGNYPVERTRRKRQKNFVRSVNDV